MGENAQAHATVFTEIADTAEERQELASPEDALVDSDPSAIAEAIGVVVRTRGETGSVILALPLCQ
jgi:hypothetical protein